MDGNMNTCIYCEGEIDPATRRCRRCGSQHPEIIPELAHELPPGKPGLPRRQVLIGLTGLAIGGAGMIGLGITSLIHAIDYPNTLVTYNGHTDSVRTLSWSPDGARIVSGGDDGTAQVWSASTGQTLIVYRGHPGVVTGVAWSPDGTRIASAGANGVHLWEPANGLLLTTIGDPNKDGAPLVWSPDGARLATGSRIWDVASQQALISPQSGDTLNGNAMAWSPDGSRLAATAMEGVILVWDASTGQTLLTYRGHATGDFQDTRAVAWSPDGTRIVSGGADDTAQIWDASTGRRLLTYHGQDTNNYGGIMDLSWSPDGSRIVSTEGSAARVWNIHTGETLFTYARLYFDWTEYMAVWSPTGNRIVSIAGDRLRVWQPT